MSNQHSANQIGEMMREEHSRIGGVDLKHVAVFDSSGSQITSFGGSPNTGNVTLNPGPNFIGLISVAQPISTTFSGNVTLDAGSKTGIAGNVTLSDSKGYIGLVTTTPSAAWPDPKTYIGLVTITGSLSPAAGNVTLDAGSKTQIVGNVTLSDAKTNIGLVTLTGGTAWVDPKAYIGLVTVGNTPNVAVVGNVTVSDSKGFIGLVSVSGFANPLPVTFSGNVTLDAGSRTAIVGNVTLSDPKTFIGLVTLGGGTAWTDPKTFIGLTTAVNGQAWPDPKTYIGLVTASNAVAWPDPKTYIGLVTVDIGTQNKVAIVGNVTLSDPKTFIGLVTLGGGTAWTDPKTYIGLATVSNATAWPDPKTYIGLATIDIGTNNSVAIKGNVTLSDPKTFIGLVTVGNKSALQKTIQTELKSLASLAAYAVDQSSVLDVSTKFGCTVFIDYAPISTSIPSVGAEFRIEASEKATGSDTWRPIQIFTTNNVAASVATGALKTVAGATVVQVLSNTGFQGGDMIYFANATTIANSEFAKVAWISGASIVLQDGMTTAQDFGGIWNKCQSFVSPLDVTPYNRIRVVANNALSPGLPITINWRAAATTADTVG